MISDNDPDRSPRFYILTGFEREIAGVAVKELEGKSRWHLEVPFRLPNEGGNVVVEILIGEIVRRGLVFGAFWAFLLDDDVDAPCRVQTIT